MLTCKLVETPMEMNHSLEISFGKVLVDIGPYQRLGKVDLSNTTRSDIAYDVSVVRQFMHGPTEEHMRALYRILRYLKGSHKKVDCTKKMRLPPLKVTSMLIGQEINQP